MPNFSPPQFSAINATPTLLSTNSAGQPSNSHSYGITFSPDGGFIAFFSDGTNLADSDTNNCRDVFVKSLQTGVVTRVSTTAAGVAGNADSVGPVFLPGGGKIAFISWASNLVAGDTNGLPDIFIKDLATGAITRASTFTDGSQFTVPEVYSTTGISAPEFSADGTKMVFTFQGAGATVYIKDLITGTLTEAVPISFSEGANKPGAQFSPDGTKLLYRQYDSTGNFSLFIKDLGSGDVTLVSTNAAGDPANRPSEGARFSPDGSHIVFTSSADNLIAGQTGGLFVKDLATGAVTWIAADGHAAVFSPDGTKVAFAAGGMLIPGGHNPFTDIYVKDLLTGELVRVSVRTDGNEAFGPNELPVWSPDGLSVGFYGDGLIQPYTNDGSDVYMARLNLPTAFVEGGPAVQIVPVAKALDLGSPNFDLGSLTVAITAGSVAGDQLSLALSGVAGESIAISGNQVFVNNIMVGTIASSATSLTISFNANANNPVVELLTEAVRISSTSDNPTAAIRTITFTLVDGEGTQDGVSDTAFFTRKVAFLPVDDQQLVGTAGDDILDGGLGNDSIDGRAGADLMRGKQGNDTYYVDSAGDVVNEAAGQGNDRVATSVSYSLTAGAEVERLEAVNSADTSAIDLTGNAFANLVIGNAGVNLLSGLGANDQLIGNAGNDFLVGGTGADLMYGGTGNDTFYVDDIGDRAYELAGEGTDRIATLISYTLDDASEVELLESTNTLDTNAMDLTGSNSANQIIGNAGVNLLFGLGANDQLIGLAGNDFLVGGTGADLMYGGAGDDTYYVDDLGDQANEAAGEGTDRIATSISYALQSGSEVELLESVNSTDTNAMDLTGSASANTIIGNNGVNVLRGESGNDLVIAHAGDDFLVGGAGNDAMFGGLGNDTYYVDSAGDTVTELAGQGNDRISTSASYTLAAGSEVETLEAVTRAATNAMDLTGNAFANTIVGNDGANVLDGKGGIDTLVGYGGADTFAFTAALGSGNVGRIADFVSGTDRIALDDAVFTGLGLGALSANAFVIGTQAQDADDRIIFNSTNGQLFFDADGNGAGAAIQFGFLITGVTSASDFVVI